MFTRRCISCFLQCTGSNERCATRTTHRLQSVMLLCARSEANQANPSTFILASRPTVFPVIVQRARISWGLDGGRQTEQVVVVVGRSIIQRLFRADPLQRTCRARKGMGAVLTGCTRLQKLFMQVQRSSAVSSECIRWREQRGASALVGWFTGCRLECFKSISQPMRSPLAFRRRAFVSQRPAHHMARTCVPRPSSILERATLRPTCALNPSSLHEKPMLYSTCRFGIREDG